MGPETRSPVLSAHLTARVDSSPLALHDKASESLAGRAFWVRVGTGQHKIPAILKSVVHHAFGGISITDVGFEDYVQATAELIMQNAKKSRKEYSLSPIRLFLTNTAHCILAKQKVRLARAGRVSRPTASGSPASQSQLRLYQRLAWALMGGGRGVG